MQRRILLLFFIITVAISLNAEWKWEQLPNPNGDDVDFVYPHQLADDWLCSSTGPIRKICLYYSFEGDVVETISAVRLSIYSDVPDPDGAGPLFSHPGTLLWDDIRTDVNYYWFGSGTQGYYDPYIPNYAPADHINYYRAEIVIPEGSAFIQTSGTIYWLSASFDLAMPTTAKVGWKTTLDGWNDEAVYWDGISQWLKFPTTPPNDRDLAFKVTEDPTDECPVELASFTAIASISNTVQLQWVAQSETDMLGYNVMRSETNNIGQAQSCNLCLIQAQNSSTEQTYTFEDIEVESATTYWYWLESVDMDGTVETFGPVCLTTGNPGQDDDQPIVVATRLLNNYPNPFAPSTTISFSLTKQMNASLRIYNVKGQLIKSLVNADMASGTHDVTWDGTNEQGLKVPSGIYFCNFETPEYRTTQKLILTK